jgi:hypothetical protein
MTPVNGTNAEPIPGYRLLEYMGKGGFGEVWKCEAPGGFLKAIKFVYHDEVDLHGEAATQELKALQRLKTIRHPFLLTIERVEVVSGQLLVVMELADRNLRETHEAAGAGGIARDDLLRYLDEAAEALDVMNLRHQLMHLDVKPDNIFIMGDHAKVGDFGLVTSLSDSGPDGRASVEAISPVYSAPEVFLGQVHPRSDQYSLAIVWYELRAGEVPFRGKTLHHLLMLHHTQEPDLSRLPDGERTALARALAKNPDDRFPCCRDFIRALRPHSARPTRIVGAVDRQTGAARTPAAPRSRVTEARPTQQLLAQRITRLTGVNPPEPPPEGAKSSAGTLTRQFISPLLRGLVRLQVEKFLGLWQGQIVSGSGDLLCCELRLPAPFVSRYPGCPDRLQVELRLSLPSLPCGAATVLDVVVRCPAGPDLAALAMLEAVGPLIVESLRNHVQGQEEKRHIERVEWKFPILVWPVWVAGRKLGEAIACQGRDLSLEGIGLLCPVDLPTPSLEIALGGDEKQEKTSFPARVVRIERRPAGYEIGASFCWGAGSTPSAAPPQAGTPRQV